MFKRLSLKDMLLNCCLKFKLAQITLRVTQIRKAFLRPYIFCELYSAFNVIKFPLQIVCHFSSKPNDFLSDYLVTYSGQRSKQTTD